MSMWRDELSRRMAGPQRHRLLQGYPMLPLMRPAGKRTLDGALGMEEAPWVQLDPGRPVIIGVLPHTQCNPRVKACGFCTFPHDPYDKRLLRNSVEAVTTEVYWYFRDHRALSRRRVDAVYFGGATANLTPKEELLALGQVLAKHVDLSGAEVTLEGVPALFRSLFQGPFEALLEIPARHRRISMGVQTFDRGALQRMGRTGFGDRRVIARVVEKAHRSGLTVSGDFLINLPFESRARMLEDVREAAALGFDQICVYHLVLTREQGSAWAQNEALLAALPPVAEAADNWLAVRDWLIQNGYVQTTLTNFERTAVHAGDRRFVYEQHSFTPDVYDAIGFGPHAISTFLDLGARRAVKLVRGKTLGFGEHYDLYFPYTEEDLRLLYLTRTLARLRVDRARYRALFGADVMDHFSGPIEAAQEAGLVVLDEIALILTPRGMFYADSVAGLFAAPRVAALRATGGGRHTRDLLNEPMKIHPRHYDNMG